MKWFRLTPVLCVLMCSAASAAELSSSSWMGDFGWDYRNRMALTCRAEPQYYYQLLRSADPSQQGEVVAMELGTNAIHGVLQLADNVPRLERAFFKLRRIPTSAPLDWDGDGISDVAELANLSQRNPFTASAGVAFADGATFVRSRADFEALSHRDNFPGAANVREVKFLILDVHTNRPRLYFLNNKKHLYHYYFARDVAGYPNSLSVFNNETYWAEPGRKNLAGSLVLHENYVDEHSLRPGIITMEFWPSDPVPYRFVQLAYDLVSRSLPFIDTRLAYHPASETQRTAYKLEKAAFEAARRSKLHVVSTEELFGKMTYSMLNSGVAFGRLVLGDGVHLSARDIPIFRVLPNDLTHVAGIITAVPQTPLSHVNLKAKQNNTPNVYIKEADVDPRLVPFLGKNVRFEALADTISIRLATQEEVDQHLESLRPPHPSIPVRNLAKTQIKPLSALGFADSDGYGAKVANVAQMRKFLPATMIPNGHAIPFYFYDEFMKANDFYTLATTIMARPNFLTDVNVRIRGLRELRDTIRAATLPQWMMDALTTVQGQFPAGTGIRCRSSTNNEDLVGFSGAGLYNSYTHRPEEGHLSKSIKQVWASLWTLRAFDEREFYRIPHLQVAMGVLMHPNYDDEIANGVAVSKNLIDPNWTGYYVNVQVGESLVTNPDPNAIPEEFLIARLLGASTYTIQYVRFSNLVPDGQTILTRTQAEDLAVRLQAIHNHFRPLYNGAPGIFAMEIEFKIDRSGKLVIKQARPWID